MHRILKGIIWGFILGSLMTAPDGAILGFFFGNFKVWLLAFSLTGALVGATIGGLGAAFGPRMILRPPGDSAQNQANDSPM